MATINHKPNPDFDVSKHEVLQHPSAVELPRKAKLHTAFTKKGLALFTLKISRIASALFPIATVIFVLAFFTKQPTIQLYAFFLAVVVAFTQFTAQVLFLVCHQNMGQKRWLIWSFVFGVPGIAAIVVMLNGLYHGQLIAPKPGLYSQLLWYAVAAFAAGSTSFGCFLTYLRTVGEYFASHRLRKLGRDTFTIAVLSALAGGAAIAANVVVLPRLNLRETPYLIYPIWISVLAAAAMGFLAAKNYWTLIEQLKKEIDHS